MISYLSGMYLFGLLTLSQGELSLTLTSDYLWRGLSQNDEKPALQAGYEETRGDWSYGLWGSEVVEPGDLELDIYANRHFSLSENLVGAIGLTHYAYTGDGSLSFSEVSVALERRGGALEAHWDPENESFYYACRIERARDRWSFSLNGGYSDAAERDYAHLTATVGWVFQSFDFALTHSITDLDHTSDKDNTSFSITWRWSPRVGKLLGGPSARVLIP